jgi:type II secretory pathway component PulF
LHFVYEAVGKSGRRVRGTAEADSLATLQREMAAKGLALLGARRSLLGAVGALRSPRLKRRVMIDLFGYLQGLLGMGMDMLNVWSAVAEAMESPATQRLCAAIRADLEQGHSLAAAMERTRAFPPLVIGNVRAAESAGALDKAFGALERHYLEEQELMQQVSKATLYPMISIVVLFMIGVGILLFIVPQLRDIFPADAPWPTRLMVWLSDGVVDSWWLLPVAAIAAGVAWTRVPDRHRQVLLDASYRAWFVGPLFKNVALAHLFQNLSLMLQAGVPLVTALEATSRTIPSKAIRARVDRALDSVVKGGLFSEGFRDTFFPSMIPAAIRQGEMTGALPTYLERLGQFLRNRSQARLHMMSTLLEPMLLLVGGGMLLFLALAIFLPIYAQIQQR